MSNLRYKAILTETGAWLEDVETGRRVRPLVGAKGNVEVAPPSATELKLQKANLDLINQQRALATKQQQEYEAMAPYLYQQMGYNYSMGADGKPSLVQMTDEEKRAKMTPEERETADVRMLANARTKKALEGKLDVDPAVEADIARGEAQLRQELLAKLGPGAEGSDSWNRAMSEFKRNMETVRYSVRHGEMTTADAIGTNRANESMRRQEQRIGQAKSATEGYGYGAGSLASATGTTEGALNRMYGQRVDAADLKMQNNQRKDAFWGGIVQGGMSLGGSAAGAAAVAF